MSKRALEMEIVKGRGQRYVTRFVTTADPDDPEALQRELSDWLDDNGHRSPRRDGYSMLVRHAGERRIRKTVRESP